MDCFENYDSRKWLVCRICLKSSEKEEMINIFDNNEHILTKIETYGGIKLDSSADLPERLCHKCLTLLRASIRFRALCARSQEQLRYRFSNAYKETEPPQDRESIDDVKQEILVEYDIADDYTNEEDETENMNNESQYDDEGMLAGKSEEPLYIEFDQVADEDVEEDESSQHSVISSKNEDIMSNEDNNDITIEELSSSPGPCRESLSKAPKKILNSEEFILPSYNVVTEFNDGDGKRSRSKRKKGESSKNVETTFVCTFCGNIYPEKSKLTLHMKVHTKERPHECEICHKRFAQTPQLARHMNSHTGNRPFKCEYCPSSFADPSTRIKHLRIHTKERPYKCETCGKSFAYSNVLKVHLQTHTGEKPHSCRICKKTFTQAHHRNTHEKLHKTHILIK